jgi:hypothetical protein
MALFCVPLLLALFLPSPLLTQWTSYAEPGGSPIAKIHPYSYTLIVAALFVCLCVGPIRFLAEQWCARRGVLQFAAIIAFCAIATVMRQGIGGVAYMMDTLLSAPLAVMLASYLDAKRRGFLAGAIILFVTFNALVGIAERLAGVHLFALPGIDQVEYFRATAFLGHPLENGFITSSVLFLVPAMPWRISRKLLIIAICMAGILAFGARMSFLFSLMIGIIACLYLFGRGLGRGELRLSTLAAAPWIATMMLAAGGALTFGTVLGERIVKLAKFDESAQARVYAFKLFDYLSTQDLLFGVDFAEIGFLLKIDPDLRILENCWIGILLLLGAVLFVPFVLSLLGYLWSLARGRSAWVTFAILNFLLVASTSNSISTKSASLMIFSLAIAGLPQMLPRRRRARQFVGVLQGQLQQGHAW